MSVNIDIMLSKSLTKTALKAKIFQILSELNIDEENQFGHKVYTITGSFDKDTNLAYKLTLTFYVKKDAESLIEYLNKSGVCNENGFTSYKVGNGRRSSFESDASESICVVGDDVISEFGDNYSFYSQNHNKSDHFRDELLVKSMIRPHSESVDTNNTFMPDSAVENDETGSLQKKESDISSKQEGKSTLLESSIIVQNDCEPSTLIGTEPGISNLVEFYCNMNLTEDDLDDVMLYLESKRKSGGGDVSQRELDKTGRFILVNYLSHLSKQRVLEKRIHEFRKLTLIANEPFDKDNFAIDNSVIIFRIDAATVDEECLKMYSENIVINDDESNDVEWIKRSLLLKNVFYVKYKLDFDYAKLKGRLAKKPKLNRARVEHERAYKTNAIVVKHLNQEKIRDMIELYFSSKKRCGVDFYSMIQIRGEHAFIFYNNSADVETILSKTHKVGDLELSVEYLYNFDLFDNQSSSSLDQSMTMSSDLTTSQSFERPMSTAASLANLDLNKANVASKAFAAPEQKPVQAVDQVVQTIKVEAPSEELDKAKSDSHLVREEIKSKPEPEENVAQTTTQLEPKQETSQIEDLSQNVHVDNQKGNTNKVEQVTNEPVNDNETASIQSKEVDSIVDILQPINILLDIEQESKLRLFVHFPNLYQQLQRELEQFDAKCAELDESGNFNCLKIQFDLQLPTSEHNYAILKKEWTQKVMIFLNEWFNKFEIKKVESQRGYTTLNELTDSLILDPEREKIIRINDNTFELLGFKAKVAELERQINELQKERTIKDELTGLQLYEIRMFYIKCHQQINETYQDLRVTVNNKAIEFEGKESDVNNAKRITQDMLNNIQKAVIPVDELQVFFMIKKMKKIVDWLKDFNFECVIIPDKDTSTLQVYSVDKKLLKTIHNQIKDAVKIVEIDQSLIEYIEKPKLVKFLDKLKNNNDILHDYNENKIKICGFEDHTSAVYQEFLANMSEF